MKEGSYIYYMDKVQKIDHVCVINFSMPSETSGSLLAPWPAQVNTKPKPGFPGKPFWGIEPVLLSEDVS